MDGDSFLLELPTCNSGTYQIYLDEFANHNTEEFKIIILDNGAFHKAKDLKIPENIGLIFLPPYSPELNPAENMWAKLKRNFTGKLFKTLDDLSVFIQKEVAALKAEQTKTTCSFPYIFSDLNWTI